MVVTQSPRVIATLCRHPIESGLKPKSHGSSGVKWILRCERGKNQSLCASVLRCPISWGQRPAAWGGGPGHGRTTPGLAASLLRRDSGSDSHGGYFPRPWPKLSCRSSPSSCRLQGDLSSGPRPQLWQGLRGQPGPGRGPGKRRLCGGEKSNTGLCQTFMVRFWF